MDRLILTRADGEIKTTFTYPQIDCMIPRQLGYLYFNKPSENIHDAVGYISIPDGWWSELIKGVDK